MSRSLALALLLLSCVSVRSQSPDSTPPPRFFFSRLSLGILPAVDFSVHTADFVSFDPTRCGVFNGGRGVGPGVGLTLEYGISTTFVLGIRGSYVNASAVFRNTMPQWDARPGDSLILVDRGHTFSPTLGYGTLSAILKIYPLATGGHGFNPFISVGSSFGVALVRKYVQREQILNTLDLVYPDGTSDIQVAAGTLTDAKTRISANAGIGHDFFFSPTFSLAPEIMVDYGMSRVSDPMKWRALIFSGGVCVRYTFAPAPPPPPPLPLLLPSPTPPGPIVIDKPAPPPALQQDVNISQLKIAVQAQTADGSTPPPIVVEEVHLSESYPFLSYMFFDSASSEIPARYNVLDSAGAAAFSEARIPRSTLGSYYNMLNIVGLRMQMNPDAKLTITGCLDDESEDRGVARARADAIRSYFANVWGIDGRRLRTVVRGRPEIKSNPDYPEGRAENRRVELSTNKPDEIFAPVLVTDVIRQATFDSSRAETPHLHFAPAVVADAGIRSWRLNIGSGSSLIRTITGKDSVPQSIDWDLLDDNHEPPATSGALLYSLSVTDKMGQTQSTMPHPLAIEQRTLKRSRGDEVTEHNIEKFSLIVFQYNTKSVSRSNRLLAEHIATHIENGSNVTVLGYTDRLGSDDYDLELAQGRAETIANIIRRSASAHDVTMDVRGVGKTDMFSNSTPEGRFFNRTVQVVINTMK